MAFILSVRVTEVAIDISIEAFCPHKTRSSEPVRQL